MSTAYPRDLLGYGSEPPHPQWPGEAKIAVSFVLNLEEGAERSVLHGDHFSEAILAEIDTVEPVFGARDLEVESVYDYGTRAGIWRLLRLFRDRNVPITLFAVGMALERLPNVAQIVLDAGHEIASHGYRWIDYQHIPETIEREHIARAIAAQTNSAGCRPLGWYTGRVSPNTRRLIVEEGGFLYDSDCYSDDLPYWVIDFGRPHLVIPYTLDANDMRFATHHGFSTADDFLSYLKATFDVLYAEGAIAPKMMSIGLHCRLAGRPGRAGAVERFLNYVLSHDRVWLCRRVDIARHWYETHPPPQ